MAVSWSSGVLQVPYRCPEDSPNHLDSRETKCGAETCLALHLHCHRHLEGRRQFTTQGERERFLARLITSVKLEIL